MARHFALIIATAILMACFVLIISTKYLSSGKPLIGHEVVDRSTSGALAVSPARRNQSSTGALSVSDTEALPADEEFGYSNDPVCTNGYSSKVGNFMSAMPAFTRQK